MKTVFKLCFKWKNVKENFQNVACTWWPIFDSFGPTFVYAGRARTQVQGSKAKSVQDLHPPCGRVGHGGVSMQQMVTPYKLLTIYKLVQKLILILCGITI